VNAEEAERVGSQVAGLVRAGQVSQGYEVLAPYLRQRIHFPLLGRIGAAVGTEPLPEVNALLDRIAEGRAEGGWVVIGCALAGQLDRDLSGALDRCCGYVMRADIWYGADILGERVPGPALLGNFDAALTLLAHWRGDPNRWVRRTAGVAVHFWAKRTRGAAEFAPRAAALLAFLEPLFGEREMDAVKGAGWGIKTLGRYYPDVTAAWLQHLGAQRRAQGRALMLRKALTYLPPDQRARALSSPEGS
jgi:hypothetical protein